MSYINSDIKLIKMNPKNIKLNNKKFYIYQTLQIMIDKNESTINNILRLFLLNIPKEIIIEGFEKEFLNELKSINNKLNENTLMKMNLINIKDEFKNNNYELVKSIQKYNHKVIFQFDRIFDDIFFKNFYNEKLNYYLDYECKYFY